MTLILFLPRDIITLAAETPCAWVLFDRGNLLLREGTTALADIPKAEKITLVLPANRVLYTQVRLPQVSVSKRESLLRYAIEDKLTTDPATIHAVLYSTIASNTDSVVAAVEREWLRDVLDVLATFGLNPHLAVDESQALPVNADGWSVRSEASHGYAVRPDGYAYGFDLTPDNQAPFSLSLAISEARKSNTAPTMLNVVGDVGESESWSTALGIPVHYHGLWSRPQMAAAILAKRPSANLLTGEFAPKSDWSARLKLAKPALMVAALIVLVQLGFTTFEVWRLTKQRDAIEAEMKEIFTQSFPQAKTIVDAPLQMTRNVQTLQNEHGTIGQTPEKALLARASAILDVANSGVKIAAIHYEKSALTVQANANGAAALAPLQARADAQQATLNVGKENAFTLNLAAAQ